MCGIVGFNWGDKEKINKLNDFLLHRGPDDSGFFSNNSVSIAQKRLSILDLSEAGHQPMAYLKNVGAISEKYKPEHLTNIQTSIVFNGEIYNFKEIRADLQAKGYVFTTNSDTEVVLASYQEWGRECLQKFNGMWAFCIYDMKKGELFLSRDRMGQKPLYYYNLNHEFIFGSEMKIFYHSDIKSEMSIDSMNHYFLMGFTPHTKTILKHVKKIQPGHYLIYDLKKKQLIKNEKYWEIKFLKRENTFNNLKKEIYTKLDNAIKIRLISDVPVGAFLSGGVDSSIIVYFMKKYLKELHTFSIKFDYDEYNESKWAKIIADKFGTIHHEISFTATEVRDLINKLPYYFDEPFGDASMIPTYLVSKVASKYVSVCLSGTGSDELFGGYTRYSEYQILNKLFKLPKSIKKIIISGYKKINRDKSQKLTELLLFTNNSKELYLKLFSHLFRSKNEPHFELESIQYLLSFLMPDDKLTAMLNFDQNIYLPNDLLVKEDRATMAHSLEGRIPFLDPELISLANSISSDFKMKSTTGKYILKKTFEGIIPNEILYRKKKGFGVPLKYYFRNELKELAQEIIFDTKSDFYDKKSIAKLWTAHQNGNSDYSPLFWNIIMFNKWQERWTRKSGLSLFS